MRAAAKVIEQARAEGHRVTVDQYPYIASSTTITAMLLPDEEREGGTQAVCSFQPQTFRDQATFQSPFEVSTGVRWVFVNGQAAINDGKLAVTDAGRPLRKVTGH